MATTVNLTTSYAGSVAGEYISAAFLSNESLQHLTVKTQVPGKMKIQRIQDNGTGFQEPTCVFTPGGIVTLDERELVLQDLAFDRELCKLTFYQDWQALAAQNGDISNVSDALVQTMLGKIAQINENEIWNGVASASSYTGLITKMVADNTINVVQSPQAITKSNVLAEIEKLIAAMPTRVKRSAEKPTIYFNNQVWEAYMYAQVGSGFATYLTNGAAVQPTFMGLYDIAVCPGMPDNTMVFAQKSNLWFGTNELSDWNEIRVIDMEPVNLDKTVRFGSKFFADTNYGFGNEIAAYGTQFPTGGGGNSNS
jgi:hypothetical protein